MIASYPCQNTGVAVLIYQDYNELFEAVSVLTYYFFSVNGKVRRCGL